MEYIPDTDSGSGNATAAGGLGAAHPYFDGGLDMVTRALAPVRFIAALALAGTWLLVPTVAVAGDPCYHGFDMPARTVAATNEVEVLPCAFGPTSAQIPVGGTVTFVNESDFDHLVTGANQEWGDRDTELRPNAKVAYTFAKPGIYPYACALHRGMSGAIIVGDVAAAGAAAPVTSTEAARTGGNGAPVAIVAATALAAALLSGGLLLVAARRRRRATVEPVGQPGASQAARR
jgi:plastocyanin